MTLAVDVLVAAGGLFMGRWLARRLRKRVDVEAVAVGEPAPAGPPVLTAFSCQLGDVVVRTAERDEAWLAGALVFEEKGPVAVLFVAPEAGLDRALFARASDPRLTWLSPLAPEELTSTRDPSPTIEHGGVRFERERRLPVRVTRLGSGAPHVGDHAVVAEYRGPGAERIVVVAGSDLTVGWVGVALEKREYDVLPGGKTTLE